MIKRRAITGERRGTLRASGPAGGPGMRWQGRPGSGNIEDRRGMGIGLPVGGGIGGLVLLLLVSALTGTNPLDLINSGSTGSGSVATSGASDDDPQKQFIAVVLKDTEDTWNQIFRERGA